MSWDDTDTEAFPDMSEKKHDALADQRWHVQDRIKKLTAERDSLLHLLATERDAFGKKECEAKVRCVNEHANAQRLIAWMNDPHRKPAIIEFTEGPEKQIAYAFENAWRNVEGP